MSWSQPYPRETHTPRTPLADAWCNEVQSTIARIHGCSQLQVLEREAAWQAWQGSEHQRRWQERMQLTRDGP